MDLNGDGNKDILSGSYSRDEQPMAGTFQVLWGKADGTFQAVETLKGTDDKPLLIPQGDNKDGADISCICTRPTAVDWDGDGNLDVITGNFGGTFYLFTGEGKGKFKPKGELVTTEEGPLKVIGHHSDPFVIDWDADGDLDVLSGSTDASVQWAENVAGPGKVPKLKAFKVLIEPPPATPYGTPRGEDEVKVPTSSTRIWVDDVNGDGKLDILAGDRVDLTTPADGLTAEEFNTKQAKWQKEWEAALADAQSAGEDEKKKTESQKRMQELYKERAKFVRQEITGFVWLYLQK